MQGCRRHQQGRAAVKPCRGRGTEEPVGPRKSIAFVSIAAGSGIAEIMRSLGVEEVIEGGQTMNPSTEDISEAIKRAHAEHVIVLPNNKNIILAAEQAAQIESECKVHVVPSKTMPQGITAMVSYDASDRGTSPTIGTPIFSENACTFSFSFSTFL